MCLSMAHKFSCIIDAMPSQSMSEHDDREVDQRFLNDARICGWFSNPREFRAAPLLTLLSAPPSDHLETHAEKGSCHFRRRLFDAINCEYFLVAIRFSNCSISSHTPNSFQCIRLAILNYGGQPAFSQNLEMERKWLISNEGVCYHILSI